MINRRKAVIGYVTWLVATRLARRIARKKVESLRPAALRNGGKGHMLNRTKTAPQAVAARATGIVEAVRPIVQRAMNDPELHAALRQAFDTGREVTTEVRGKPPKNASKRIARDQKLLKRVEMSAADLQSAVKAVVKEPKKEKGFVRKVAAPVLMVGGAAAAVWYGLKKSRGGGQEPPY
jgi:hypothetical protein